MAEESEYKERKRSKRHRRKRNHISKKDLVDCITAFARHAREVQAKNKARFVKPSLYSQSS